MPSNVGIYSDDIAKLSTSSNNNAMLACVNPTFQGNAFFESTGDEDLDHVITNPQKPEDKKMEANESFQIKVDDDDNDDGERM